MARVCGYLVKALGIGAVVGAGGRQVMSFLAWAWGREYLWPLMFLSMALLALAAACLSAAILLVKRRDLVRVTINVSIMLACTMFGWMLRDPIAHGSGESERELLFAGSLGAIIGYLLTLVREERGQGTPVGRPEAEVR